MNKNNYILFNNNEYESENFRNEYAIVSDKYEQIVKAKFTELATLAGKTEKETIGKYTLNTTYGKVGRYIKDNNSCDTSVSVSDEETQCMITSFTIKVTNPTSTLDKEYSTNNIRIYTPDNESSGFPNYAIMEKYTGTTSSYTYMKIISLNQIEALSDGFISILGGSSFTIYMGASKTPITTSGVVYVPKGQIFTPGISSFYFIPAKK